MSEPKVPAPKAPVGNTSRIVVSGLVALLIVVAVAGIVLAGRRNAQPALGTVPLPGSGQVTPGDAVSPTTAAATQAGASMPSANEIRFEGAADKLPAGAADVLARFADQARSGGGNVVITARFAAGGDRNAKLAMNARRLEVIQHALEADGIAAARLQKENIETPPSLLPGDDANCVQLALR